MKHKFKIKEPYHTYYIHPVTGYARSFPSKWMDDTIDNTRLAEGRVFLTADEARIALEKEKAK